MASKLGVSVSAGEPSGESKPGRLERFPSSAAGSYRSSSVTSGQGQPRTQNMWNSVRRSLVK